jgi:stage II sporulation protein AA (anti-sigma F factor antagonist)
MSWSLTIHRDSTGGVAVLRVAGRLGTASSGDLVEAVQETLREGSRGLLLDLTGVDYASSAGLMSLDAICGLVHVAQGTLVLCGVSEPVRLALDLSGLLSNFVIENSSAEATARLRAAHP